MRLRSNQETGVRRRNMWLLLLTAPLMAGGSFSYAVVGGDVGSWPAILSSIGLLNGPVSDATVVVAPQGTNGPAAAWATRVERGTILVVEGESPLAVAFGFHVSSKPRVTVRSVEDLRAPGLRIIWERPLVLPVFEMPPEAKIFARERWEHVPLMAGFRRGAGAVLWIAARPDTAPGEPRPSTEPHGESASEPHIEPNPGRGYERFPYI